jgi:dUTP pyrophosphatase
MGSLSIMESIKNKSKIKPNGFYKRKNISGSSMVTAEWSGNNALDFMDWIYSESKLNMQRKRDLFWDWSSWVPGISSGKTKRPHQTVGIRWVKTSDKSVVPFKERASDSGYDLVLIEKLEEIYPDVFVYETGIKTQIEFGWWLMLVGRSSISKSGYQIVNCLGVLDRNYVGTIKVALKKINSNVPDLVLPARIVQIIPMPAVHFELEEVQELSETDRGTKGFGSSGK